MAPRRRYYNYNKNQGRGLRWRMQLTTLMWLYRVPYSTLFIGQRFWAVSGIITSGQNYPSWPSGINYILAARYFSIALRCFHASVEVSLPALFLLEPSTELVIELHFSRPPFSRTSRTSLRTVGPCRPSASSASRNWILPHNIDKCLFGRFCVLRRTKRLAPLWLNYFDVRHSPSAGTVRYNYITQKVVNEGCPKSYMQKQ